MNFKEKLYILKKKYKIHWKKCWQKVSHCRRRTVSLLPTRRQQWDTHLDELNWYVIDDFGFGIEKGHENKHIYDVEVGSNFKQQYLS